MTITSHARYLLAVSSITLLITVAGCGPYVSAPKRYSDFGSGLHADLPSGWLQYTESKDGFTITRDGLRLEKITIRTTRVGKKIEGIDRVYDANMMPHEVADLSIGLMKAKPDMKSFEVEKIDTARMAGQDGYKVDARYIDEGGLCKRLRLYGAVMGKYVCEFLYEAAEPDYFHRYEDAFENTVSSVKAK